MVRDKAEVVVWLDPARAAVMTAVVARTLGRLIMRKKAWNGNRERLRTLFDRRPEENIILWTWTQFPVYRMRYALAMADPVNLHLDFARLGSRRETRDWLESVNG